MELPQNRKEKHNRLAVRLHGDKLSQQAGPGFRARKRLPPPPLPFFYRLIGVSKVKASRDSAGIFTCSPWVSN